MKTYIVLYRDDSLEPHEAPFGFVCKAEDTDHAEEQCENARPDADIVCVHELQCIEMDAYAEYWEV